MEQQYELVFYGRLVEGESEAQVKANIAQLFKASAEQVERMFTGKRVVIRNKLNAETAQKYVVAMRKRGAVCEIEIMGQPGVKADLSQPAAEQTASAPAPTPATPSDAATEIKRPATAAQTPTPTSPATGEGLHVAGDKTDEVLAGTHFSLDPVGVRLSEHVEVEAPLFPDLDALTIAPVGSDLAEKKEELPVNVPDISHLSLDNKQS